MEWRGGFLNRFLQFVHRRLKVGGVSRGWFLKLRVAGALVPRARDASREKRNAQQCSANQKHAFILSSRHSSPSAQQHACVLPFSRTPCSSRTDRNSRPRTS